jgi:hypothetical protein
VKQGGYDWDYVACAVGSGGSIIWFGWLAGVVLSDTYPETTSVGFWVSHGWHVAVGYVIGFFGMSPWWVGTPTRHTGNGVNYSGAPWRYV